MQGMRIRIFICVLCDCWNLFLCIASLFLATIAPCAAKYIYVQKDWRIHSMLDSAFNTAADHIKTMMGTPHGYPLLVRYAIGDAAVYCIFRPDFFHLTDSFVSSSESGTQFSCHHLWPEAEYRGHLKLSTTALDRTCGPSLRFVLATRFFEPILHHSWTPEW